MPYLNFNKEKRINAEINVGVGFKGQWNVEIINPDRQTSYFPFGEEMKDNLLTQSFYDLFINLTSSNPSPRPSQLMANAIAVVGDGVTAADISDYKLVNQIRESNFTVPDGNLCGYTDNLIAGSRTFYRQWDFVPNMESDQDINEAGFKNPWDTYLVSGVTTYKLFSRFVFPATVTIPKNAILRLKYSLTCMVPAVVTPIEVTISYGDFVGDGLLKLTGIWDAIFGMITSDGKDGYLGQFFGIPPDVCAILPIISNYSPAWYLYYGSGAVQVTDFFADFPEINYPIDNINYENSYRSKSATQFIGYAICNNSIDGSVEPLPASSGEKGCRYTFGPLNPEISNENWGGIFFMPRSGVNTIGGSLSRRVIVCTGSWNGAGQLWNPTYTFANKPEYFGLTQCLWFWKFNNKQIRYTDQSVQVEIKQSAIINP